jgi:hypothetical protein
MGKEQKCMSCQAPARRNLRVPASRAAGVFWHADFCLRRQGCALDETSGRARGGVDLRCTLGPARHEDQERAGRCAGPAALFLRLMGVLILNLQPEAASGEFVAGDVALGQLPRRVSCEWVWTSVLQWAIVSGLFVNKSEATGIYQTVEKDFDTCNRDEAPVRPRRSYCQAGSVGRVELCVASPRIRCEPPYSLSRGRRVTVLKLRPPQTPGLDRTAALSSNHSPLLYCEGHSDILIASRAM